MGMLAHVDFDPQTDEQRRTPRRTLRLDVEGGASATVRNLSERGLLIESLDDLKVDDRVSLDLPLAGAAEARVVWARAPFFGCEFARPISRAVVSAALLSAPIDEPPVTLLGPADTTWNLPEIPTPAMPKQSTASVLGSLVFLASAISFLVLALASFQTV